MKKILSLVLSVVLVFSMFLIAYAEETGNCTSESGHDWVIEKSKEATCTEDGKTVCVKCASCEAVLLASEGIPALGHDWVIDKEKSKEATCTEEGQTVYKCSRCGINDESKTETVPVKEHSYKLVEAVAATCTENGKTACVKCASCEAVLLASEEIPALGHDWVIDKEKSKEATCTEEGQTVSKCENENCEETKTEEISAKGHKYSEEIVPATLKKDGKIINKCSVCEDVKNESTISKVSSIKLSSTSFKYDGGEHKPTVTVKDSKGKKLEEGKDYKLSYSNSKSKSSGKYTVTVTLKGNYKGTKTLTYYIHNYKEKTTKATFTKNGSIETKCTVCGDVSSKTVIYKVSEVSLSSTSYTPDGKVHKPTVTVKDSKGKKLEKGEDYELSYSDKNSKSCGEYTVTVKLKGNYDGTKKLKYYIHDWKDSQNCKKCNLQSGKDKIVKHTSIVMKPDVYTVGEKYHSTITMTVKCKKHTYTTTSSKTPVGFSTKKAGEKSVEFKFSNGDELTCKYTVKKK